MFEIYGSIPSGSGSEPDHWNRVAEVARWAEAAGFRGVLVYTDNWLPDPWMTSAAILSSTTCLVPLVAVQPNYCSPLAVAKTISTVAHVSGRPIDLNIVSGGFVRDLASVGDSLAKDHDRRYERLFEFTALVDKLLRSPGTVSFDGEYYRAQNLRLHPEMPLDCRGTVYVSGGSTAAMDVAERLQLPRLSYVASPEAVGPRGPQGVRLGIVARDLPGEAWSVARKRFPASPEGARIRRTASALSQSTWTADLDEASASGGRHTLWMHPYQTYQSFCPYVVGTPDEVLPVLQSFHDRGVRSLILDPALSEQDYLDAAAVIRKVE